MTNATVDLNGAWKIHTPNLFKEVMNNHGAWALAAPLRILSQKLAEVAARFAAIDQLANVHGWQGECLYSYVVVYMFGRRMFVSNVE